MTITQRLFFHQAVVAEDNHRIRAIKQIKLINVSKDVISVIKLLDSVLIALKDIFLYQLAITVMAVFKILAQSFKFTIQILNSATNVLQVVVFAMNLANAWNAQ